MNSTRLALTVMLTLAACDKQVADNEGDTTTDTGTDTSDVGPEDCELLCGGLERECEYDSCCACAIAGGDFLILESYPPQYGCDAGNGPPNGWEPTECNWGECEDQVSALAVDDVFAPVGLSPQELIDVIGEPMAAPYTWDQTELQLNVPGPATEVSFTAIPTGEYRGIERIWVPPADLPDLEGSCTSSVEVVVDVTLTTADGALNETFVGAARSVGDANIDLNPPSVELAHAFDIGSFEGTLELSVDNPDSTLDPAAQLDVQFGRIGGGGDRSGSLSIGVQTVTEDWASATWTEFGSWPG